MTKSNYFISISSERTSAWKTPDITFGKTANILTEPLTALLPISEHTFIRIIRREMHS